MYAPSQQNSGLKALRNPFYLEISTALSVDLVSSAANPSDLRTFPVVNEGKVVLTPHTLQCFAFKITQKLCLFLRLEEKPCNFD